MIVLILLKIRNNFENVMYHVMSSILFYYSGKLLQFQSNIARNFWLKNNKNLNVPTLKLNLFT